jgi:hypothetical protein
MISNGRDHINQRTKQYGEACQQHKYLKEPYLASELDHKVDISQCAEKEISKKTCKK